MSNAELGKLEKERGNIYYKKKEFNEALECYDSAIKYDPSNIAFYSNKAAVYFEQGEYERCREECLKAIEIGKSQCASSKLISKAMVRLGNSYFKQKCFEDAKIYFLQALHENHSTEIKEKVKLCEDEIEERVKLAYVNPDIAIAEKELGDRYLNNNDLKSALKHYTEAIKRNPSAPKLYLRRAISLLKLGKQKEALLDCEKCLAVDPNLTKGYLVKGAMLESLGRYDHAMDSYTIALNHDPNNRDALKAYYRCLDKDYKRRNDASNVLDRTVRDPEIAKMLFSIDSEIPQNASTFKQKLQQHIKHNPDDMRLLMEYGQLMVQEATQKISELENPEMVYKAMLGVEV